MSYIKFHAICIRGKAPTSCYAVYSLSYFSFCFKLHVLGWHWVLDHTGFKCTTQPISSACGIVHSSPQVKSLLVTLYPPFIHSLLSPLPTPFPTEQSPYCCLCLFFFFCLIPSPFFPSPPNHLTIFLSCWRKHVFNSYSNSSYPCGDPLGTPELAQRLF